MSSLADPFRLATLHRTGLLDGVASPVLAAIARLATTLLGVPVALVSLVDERGQHFPGLSGLEGWAAEARGTPLSHSFCQHVVRQGTALVVSDAAAHPLVRDNLARTELGVRAYLGMPLTTSEGDTLGAICAIDGAPREWTPAELDTLRQLATLAMAELAFRATAHALEQTQTALEHAEARLARVLETAHLGTWEWDVRTDHVAVDAASGVRFGLAPGVSGLPLADFLALVHPDDRLAMRAALDDARHGRDVRPLVLRVVGPAGSSHLLLDAGTPERDAHGAIIGLAGMVRDLTSAPRPS